MVHTKNNITFGVFEYSAGTFIITSCMTMMTTGMTMILVSTPSPSRQKESNAQINTQIMMMHLIKDYSQ